MTDILVIDDREKSKFIATNRAIALAEKLGCGVHVVSFAYEPMLDMSELISAEIADKVKAAALEGREEALTAHLLKNTSKVKVRCSYIWEKSVADWVAKNVEVGAYLCVIKTAARTENLFYTSTDWRLMRECVVPVMIVAAKKWKKQNNILAAVDLSSKSKVQKELNEKVVSTAVALSERMGGVVHVCHVLELPQVLIDLDLIDKREFQKKARAKSKDKMAALLAEFSAAVPEKQQHIVFGNPVRKIPSLANSLKADMVVMGSVGRKGAKGKFLGNTAEKMLNHLYTDVYTLRP